MFFFIWHLHFLIYWFMVIYGYRNHDVLILWVWPTTIYYMWISNYILFFWILWNWIPKSSLFKYLLGCTQYFSHANYFEWINDESTGSIIKSHTRCKKNLLLELYFSRINLNYLSSIIRNCLRGVDNFLVWYLIVVVFL